MKTKKNSHPPRGKDRYFGDGEGEILMGSVQKGGEETREGVQKPGEGRGGPNLLVVKIKKKRPKRNFHAC